MRNLKMFRSFGATLLALVMALSLAVPAFASENDPDVGLANPDEYHRLADGSFEAHFDDDNDGICDGDGCEYAMPRTVEPGPDIETDPEPDEPEDPPVTQPGKTTLVINNAISGAKYRIIKVMALNAKRETVDTDGFGNIVAYDYVLEDNAVGKAVKAVIAAGDVVAGDTTGEKFTFAAQPETGTVTKAGFKVYVNQTDSKTHVAFCVPAVANEDPKVTYTNWYDANGQVFMTKFADAVKLKLEGESLDNLGTTVTAASGQSNATFVPLTGNTSDTQKTTSTGTLTVHNLDYGYYVIISGAGQRAMLYSLPDGDGSKGETMTINEKNKAPGINKYVKEEATGNYEDKNDKAIGDTVEFMAVLDVGTGINNLKFVDTLSEGLTYVDGSVKVYFAPRAHDGRDLLDKDGVTEDNLLDWTRTDFRDYIREIYPTGNGSENTNYAGYGGWTGMTNLTTVAETGNVLTVDFRTEWLKSMRQASETAAGEFTRDPMYPDDVRLKDYTVKDHALYNPYLGDMTTPDDDGGLIVITYKATVNEKAVIGGSGNTNKAKLEYGNKPGETIETAEDETRTYVYGLDVLKHVAGDPANKLSGATFTMKRAGLQLDGDNVTTGTDGSKTIELASIPDMTAVANLKFVKINVSEDGKSYEYRLAKADEEGVAELVSDKDGRIVIQGLDSDLYELTETEAPSGYILADKPIYAVLGSVHSGSAKLDGITVTSSHYEQDKTNVTQFGSVTRIAIENASGLRMPETGGIGTTIFYVAGAALVLGAGVLLVVKKRVGHPED